MRSVVCGYARRSGGAVIKRLSLSTRILIGLGLGVVGGLFFGEFCSPMAVIGDAFIGLLQMTALPYIVLALLVNIGRLSLDRGRRLVANGLVVLTLLTAVGLTVVLVAPLALPQWSTASFFSTSLVEPPPHFDLVGLYIPTNPFASLANNVVPAVVVFCILLGIALSRLEGTERLLDDLDLLADALNKVNKMVIQATPVGVFAIAASTAGTITLEEIGRLQAYLLIYSVAVVVLVFWVLPTLVEACTPISARDFLRIPKATLLTIFATGKIIVVLPQLVENVKEIFRKSNLDSEEMESSAEVIMPLAYPFPNMGSVAIMVFVPFASWYLGSMLSVRDWVVLLAAGSLSSFVAPVVGVPFLMGLVRIPSDMFQLFVMSTVYTDRIRVVLGAAHLLALTILVTAALVGVLKIRWVRLLRSAGITLVLVVLFGTGIHLFLGRSFRDSYSADQAFVNMHMMRSTANTKAFLNERPPLFPVDPERSRLDQVLERGVLRVGFQQDQLPFAFVNSEGRAVGFDLEMANHLATDLGVELELVRLERGLQADRLVDGTCDIVMGGLVVTPSKALRATFSQPYLDQILSVIVRDHRQGDFSSRKRIQKLETLKVGIVPSLLDWAPRLRSYAPQVEVVELASPRPFLRGEREDLDALLFPAEAGSAWTLLYPEYSVAVPQEDMVKVPMAYALPPGEVVFTNYINSWIETRRRDGTIDQLFEHWILGSGAQDLRPRWSVIRDVLGWVE